MGAFPEISPDLLAAPDRAGFAACSGRFPACAENTALARRGFRPPISHHLMIKINTADSNGAASLCKLIEKEVPTSNLVFYNAQ